MEEAELIKRYTYHAPKNDQAERYTQLRERALEFAKLINALCPDSRERSLAFTHLDDVVYCANASIARNE